MHIPVLLKEALSLLDPQSGDTIVDATANGGGHFLEIAKRVSPKGVVIGIEADREIFENLQKKIIAEGLQMNTLVVHGNYANLSNILREKRIHKIQGIVFDLGLSSLQLENSKKGFSFQKDEPLDMRFDPDAGTYKASDVINHGTPGELEMIFRTYGEERYARKIANAIVDERKRRPILTTTELVRVIAWAIPKNASRQKIHFATRVFQALRIAVNNELENIKKGIESGISMLAPKGRIVVIAFHSIEDRIVKEVFKKNAKEGAVALISKKPITPTQEEIRHNHRARSAKLRVAEKII